VELSLGKMLGKMLSLDVVVLSRDNCGRLFFLLVEPFDSTIF